MLLEILLLSFTKLSFNLYIINSLEMRTWSSSTLFKDTLPTFYDSLTDHALQQCDYLSNMNYHLHNEVNDAETQKYFYRNKLSDEYKNHTSKLEQMYKIVSEKNSVILGLEQSTERARKDYRILEEGYAFMKTRTEQEKEYYETELQDLREKHAIQLNQIEDRIEKKYELKCNKRIDEIKRETDERINQYKKVIQELRISTDRLTKQVQTLQEERRQILIQNDIKIQETVHRQLRKRDFEAQNAYLRDVSQYEASVKDRRQLREQLQTLQEKVKNYKKRMHELEGEKQTINAKYLEICEVFEEEKRLRREEEEKNTKNQSKQVEVNTEKLLVPIVMPVDMDLMSQIVSLREFVVEKIVERFLSFFCLTAVTDPKKKSHSFTTFKQSFQQLKSSNPENKILLFFYSSLQRVIKTFCPTMYYAHEYTLKDQFIKRTVLECEKVSNPIQRLFRMLELLHRLKHPINHVHTQISEGQLRAVEVKLIMILKKCFS